MKKSILQSFCFCFIASTFIIATASCGNSKGGETNEDSINQAHIDSINQEKKDSINQAKTDSIREDSIRRNRVTPDLALFELKGPVKSVDKNFISIAYSGGANFDKDGNITSLTNGAKFKRTSDGKINRLSSDKISYNKDSQPISFSWSNSMGEGSSKNRSCTYTDGKLSSYFEKQEGVEGSFHVSKINASYTYLEYDNYGNWTKRRVNIVDKNTNENETQDGEVTRTLRSNKTQTRVITYYE